MPPGIHGTTQSFPVTRTDSNGNYSFPLSLPAGAYAFNASAGSFVPMPTVYLISAYAPGFLPATFNRSGSSEGAFQRFDSWTYLHDIDFRLKPRQ
jgi:hypothetical protein